jgi:hypothetical protein
MLTDEKLHERHAVERSIIHECREWGITIRMGLAYERIDAPLYCYGSWHFDLIDTLKPIIILRYDEDCPPNTLWWVFLHELGHCFQWLEMPGSGAVYCANYHYSQKSTQRYEIDAWNRACDLAWRIGIYPPCKSFTELRKYALSTYGVHE